MLFLFIRITSATDQVVSNCGDTGGSTQFRAKLAAAENTGGGTITFTCGPATIVLTQGLLVNIAANTTIDGGNKITLSGNDAMRLFVVQSGVTFTLKNITLTKGHADGDGGAVHNSGTLNISNSKFLQNQTTDSFSGGAIVNYGNLQVTNTEFAFNKGGNAGAIYPRFAASSTTIRGCNFHDNQAVNTNAWGGALLLWDGAVVTVDSTIFRSNHANLGGAFYIFPGSKLSLTNSTLNTNTANGSSAIWNQNGIATVTNVTAAGNSSGYAGCFFGYLGGIYYLTNITFTGNSSQTGGGLDLTDATANLNHVTFNGNTAQYGGAIFNTDGNLNLNDVTLNDNSAILGGGIFTGDSSDTTITNLTNVTLSNNSASSQGGGIYVGSPDGMGTSTANLTNVTFKGNSAPEGGGIYNVKTVNIKNTLIVKGTSGANCAGVTGGSFNLSDDNSCGFGAGRDGVTNINLGPLANNGGFTQTHLPLAGSAAIDNATTAGAPSRDQRGYLRVGAGPDVGSTEYQGVIAGALGNISTRGFVQTGNNVLIGGVIVTGGGGKKVIIRALGPTLGKPPFNVPGALANPTLELRNSSNVLVASNDNWGTASNKQAIIDSGLAPPDSLESAILTTLNPGNYTAIVRGVNNTTGVALVEAYDLDFTAGSEFDNISTRGFVQTGANIMIAGVIVHGPDNQEVLVRGLGPTLSQFGVPTVLADPTLDLRDANGNSLITNDNWKDNQEAQIQASGLAPPNDNESAIRATLTPGNYTAILSGKNNATGNALVEVYALN